MVVYFFEIGQSYAKLCEFDLYGIGKHEMEQSCFQSMEFIIGQMWTEITKLHIRQLGFKCLSTTVTVHLKHINNYDLRKFNLKIYF